MTLNEVFASEQSKVVRVVAVLNLSDDASSADNPAKTTLERFVRLYDLALETLPGYGGDILKHAGRSLYLAFEPAQATQAINFVIRLQERATQSRTFFGAGLACGEVAWFQTPERGSDYLGLPLDQAAALAHAANGRAVFADEATVQAAAMGQLESEYAKAEPKHNHLGPRWDLRAEGFRQPLAFHEVVWEGVSYGMRPDYMSGKGVESVNPNQWVKGTVARLGPKFGFITDDAGEVYYFQPRNLALEAELKRGAKVVFRPLPPVRGTKQKRAEDIFAVNAPAQGTLTRVHPKGWGFVRLDCQNGLEHDLFVLGVGEKYAVGQAVRCRIGSNDQGPMGYQPEAASAHAA